MTHEEVSRLADDLLRQMEKEGLARYEFDNDKGWRVRIWYNKKLDERLITKGDNGNE